MMDSKNFLSDRFEQDAMKDLTRMLEEELVNPPEKRDYKKIEQTADAYTALSKREEEVQKAAERGMARLEERLKKNPISIKSRRFKVLLTAGIAAATLLTANAVTLFAANQNIVSFIIEKSESGFSVQPIPDTVIELPTTPDDPYGIKAECAKYGLEVEAPTYLPEGFVLWNVYELEQDVLKEVNFMYHRGKTTLVFSYAELYDMNAKANIPSDHFNLEEIIVNGKPAVTSKEDSQYTLLYYDNNMEYFMFSEFLDYAECDKIVKSIKK